MRSLLTGLVLALCAGCVHRVPLQREALLELPAGTFHLTWLDSDTGDAERTRQALERALPRLARWGTLREPVHVQVLPSQAALAQAVGLPGQGTLRAWGRYDEVLLQAPRTWGLWGASQAELEEVLTHELTHCLMYQLASDRLGWRRKGIAPWFREGMASYTASQEARWPDRESVARKLRERPEWELLGPSQRAWSERPQWAYGAAHQAFASLIHRHGEAAVRELLEHMRQGASFPESFQQVLGLTPEEFLQGVVESLRVDSAGTSSTRRLRDQHASPGSVHTPRSPPRVSASSRQGATPSSSR